MTLPSSLLLDLDQIPHIQHVALLMRHAERFPILDAEHPYESGLTEAGVEEAEELGRWLGYIFQPGRMRAAPVTRCLDTVLGVTRGAGWDVPVLSDERLSHSFMARAYQKVEQNRFDDILPFQVQVTLRFLLDMPAQNAEEGLPHLHLMVSHDTVLAALVGWLLRVPILGSHWPGYLEGFFLWRAGDLIIARWRGQEKIFSQQSLGLS